MTRLRKAIAHYNATAGARDMVTLIIPKGSYRPVITVTEPLEQDARPSPTPTPSQRFPITSSWAMPLASMVLVIMALTGLMLTGVLRIPGQQTVSVQVQPPLLVMQPPGIGQDRRLNMIVEGVQAEVAAELARQAWLTVIQPSSLNEVRSALTTASASRAVYLLDIRIAELGSGYKLTTFLKRWPDEAVRWSGSHEGSSLARQSGHVLQDVGSEIARDLSAPGGAISMAEVARIDGETRHDVRFACLMSIRRYWRSYEPALRADAKACIVAALRTDPDFMSGRAALAFLRIEDARMTSGSDRDALLAEARLHLAGASSGNLLSESAQLALAACENNAVAVRAIADRLVTAYPNNPDVLADTGSKLGLFLGDWQQALAVEARAMTLNPSPDSWYPLSTIAKAMMDGNYPAASELLSKVPQRSFQTGQIVRLAVGGAAGDANMVADASTRLRELGVPDSASAIALVESQCWSREVKQLFQRGLSNTRR